MHPGVMERPGLDHLPRAYQIGLRLRELGADDDLIGDCLGIDPAAVPTLIEIGRLKLESDHGADQQIGLPDWEPDPPVPQ
jgi:hypothetical protein